jgi:cysteine desulfurase family protein (TIGR01976 family)
VEFPLDFVRDSFPALTDPRFIYFDNAAGTQVPGGVIDAVREHLVQRNVQRGARYRFSEEVDQMVRLTRESLATFVNAFDPDEIVFGLNATSFIRSTSLAIADMLKPGDEIVVTELDHEANIAPWLALEEREIKVKFWPVDKESSVLSIGRLDEILSDRTRLVAVTKASNAVGTIVDLIPVAERIHAKKGYLFVDAVHFAPHGPLDVRFLGCDFLVCSGYKIFGPHIGFMWGKKEILDSLPAFREFFIEDRAPHKYEVGTFSYEAVAGMNAAIGYVEELGRRSQHLPLPPEEDIERRADIRRGMQAIRHYERTLTTYLLQKLEELEFIQLYGLTDPDQAALRTPTFFIDIEGMDPSEVAGRLAKQDIFVREGHAYSPRLLRALGLDENKGAVRASLVHYNSGEEADRFIEALQKMKK